MRIVGGKYRAKKLFAPENELIRPTSDRAREAVFNILYSAVGGVDGKKVLDVFAGTGALGFEALSRGAQKVCFIDKDVAVLLKNATMFSSEKQKIDVLRADVQNLPFAKDTFDIVFSDAPYDKGLNEIALKNLEQKGFLKNGTICIVETRKNEDMILPVEYALFDERVYGMAKIRFYTFCK
ncbi:MAG: 16S rRNA (guanine(966)-N(2))-methyltransferase RsmD [Alphaproteobacteria bacterium]|nr:16S rRNA (guanine(966)-N(2))-methyltransferase RsmD [Alphaproteobacteria bacterium]